MPINALHLDDALYANLLPNHLLRLRVHHIVDNLVDRELLTDSDSVQFVDREIDEIVEREDPATFSPQRRKAIYDGLLSLDVSPERANAFIDHPKSWELRPIKFVAYDEGLYEALRRAAR